LTTQSAKLVAKYGKNYVERNIYRMTLFAEWFADTEILTTLSAKLTWSHILEFFTLTVESGRYRPSVGSKNQKVPKRADNGISNGKNKLKVRWSDARYFDQNETPDAVSDTVEKALEMWFAYQKEQAEADKADE
jgi:hypothetical protein